MSKESFAPASPKVNPQNTKNQRPARITDRAIARQKAFTLWQSFRNFVIEDFCFHFATDDQRQFITTKFMEASFWYEDALLRIQIFPGSKGGAE